ncbi:ankyrin [Strigomonas culicis]|uniref:Ankyrin n=1 Tax=Strigomonas culicis TaxID=28005 RepID=S9ULU8_9TRYP|nr:ankyrin [Strigomonas culicis]EPY26279.1 ankyrin [Strigomonas culicis]EPY29923.1 ankyrin [Strigomonas culicis]EPY33156.1 ankyrin [Strigomonas culicis]|eukprot:EPY21011.1 ankyrin [Strigomonas culicis]
MAELPKAPRRVKSDDENMEKIHAAARKGNLDEVRRLVEVGVDPTLANRFGCTALHLACKHGQVDTAKYLTRVGDVLTSWHGQKPLHLAVLSNQLPLVQALVDGAHTAGRSIDAQLNECDEMALTEVGGRPKPCRGQTALHWCIALGDDYLPMLRLLTRLGASPTAKDRDGETPLMRAMEFNNSAALEAMLQEVKPSALRLDFLDAQGRSHLHWAILSNEEQTALQLLEMGHDPNVEDNEHIAPVILAVRGALVRLTAKLLEIGDPFIVQSAPFHNGTTMMADRIAWLPYVAARERATEPEALRLLAQDKQQVIQLMQEKLDSINRSFSGTGDEDGGTVKKKKGAPGAGAKMKLAPSAPIRSKSTSKPRLAKK